MDDPDTEIFDEIQELWDAYGDTSHRIVIDVPIGLCESLDADECLCQEADGELSRECDDLARRVVGEQYRSVFTAPARQAAELAAEGRNEYAEITEKNRALTGKGLSQQAASISRGIVEVENLLRNGGDEKILVEGHPEVCFRAFNGESLTYSKKTAPGVDERLSAIVDVPEYSDDDWRTLARALGDENHTVQLDDLLDALVLALTACADDVELQTLPLEPPVDARGLPMQMVYRSVKDL
jgi:predicted RNase H-like nuclease